MRHTTGFNHVRIIGVAWLILALGIVLTTVGDTWYSYLDVCNLYTDSHPVNLLWYAGYLVQHTHFINTRKSFRKDSIKYF